MEERLVNVRTSRNKINSNSLMSHVTPAFDKSCSLVADMNIIDLFAHSTSQTDGLDSHCGLLWRHKLIGCRSFAALCWQVMHINPYYQMFILHCLYGRKLLWGSWFLITNHVRDLFWIQNGEVHRKVTGLSVWMMRFETKDQEIGGWKQNHL